MVTNITVTSYNGEEHILRLANSENDLLAVTNIEGLGPVESSFSSENYATKDGLYITNSSTGGRNIVITGKLNTMKINQARQYIYRVFPTKMPVKLTFLVNGKDQYITSGYVENVGADYFGNLEGAQISILCPDPMFYSVNGISASTSDTLDEEGYVELKDINDEYAYRKITIDTFSDGVEYYTLSNTKKYIPTEPTDEYDPNKNYYIFDGYKKTDDTEFIPGKKYYTKSTSYTQANLDGAEFNRKETYYVVRYVGNDNAVMVQYKPTESTFFSEPFYIKNDSYTEVDTSKPFLHTVDYYEKKYSDKVFTLVYNNVVPKIYVEIDESARTQIDDDMYEGSAHVSCYYKNGILNATITAAFNKFVAKIAQSSSYVSIPNDDYYTPSNTYDRSECDYILTISLAEGVESYVCSLTDMDGNVVTTQEIIRSIFDYDYDQNESYFYMTTVPEYVKVNSYIDGLDYYVKYVINSEDEYYVKTDAGIYYTEPGTIVKTPSKYKYPKEYSTEAQIDYFADDKKYYECNRKVFEQIDKTTEEATYLSYYCALNNDFREVPTDDFNYIYTQCENNEPISPDSSYYRTILKDNFYRYDEKVYKNLKDGGITLYFKNNTPYIAAIKTWDDIFTEQNEYKENVQYYVEHYGVKEEATYEDFINSQFYGYHSRYIKYDSDFIDGILYLRELTDEELANYENYKMPIDDMELDLVKGLAKGVITESELRDIMIGVGAPEESINEMMYSYMSMAQLLSYNENETDPNKKFVIENNKFDELYLDVPSSLYEPIRIRAYHNGVEYLPIVDSLIYKPVAGGETIGEAIVRYPDSEYGNDFYKVGKIVNGDGIYYIKNETSIVRLTKEEVNEVFSKIDNSSYAIENTSDMNKNYAKKAMSETIEKNGNIYRKKEDSNNRLYLGYEPNEKVEVLTFDANSTKHEYEVYNDGDEYFSDPECTEEYIFIDTEASSINVERVQPDIENQKANEILEDTTDKFLLETCFDFNYYTPPESIYTTPYDTMDEAKQALKYTNGAKSGVQIPGLFNNEFFDGPFYYLRLSSMLTPTISYFNNNVPYYKNPAIAAKYPKIPVNIDPYAIAQHIKKYGKKWNNYDIKYKTLYLNDKHYDIKDVNLTEVLHDVYNGYSENGVRKNGLNYIPRYVSKRLASMMDIDSRGNVYWARNSVDLAQMQNTYEGSNINIDISKDSNEFPITDTVVMNLRPDKLVKIWERDANGDGHYYMNIWDKYGANDVIVPPTYSRITQRWVENGRESGYKYFINKAYESGGYIYRSTTIDLRKNGLPYNYSYQLEFYAVKYINNRTDDAFSYRNPSEPPRIYTEKVYLYNNVVETHEQISLTRTTYENLIKSDFDAVFVYRKSNSTYDTDMMVLPVNGCEVIPTYNVYMYDNEIIFTETATPTSLDYLLPESKLIKQNTAITESNTSYGGYSNNSYLYFPYALPIAKDDILGDTFDDGIGRKQFRKYYIYDGYNNVAKEVSLSEAKRFPTFAEASRSNKLSVYSIKNKNSTSNIYSEITDNRELCKNRLYAIMPNYIPKLGSDLVDNTDVYSFGNKVGTINELNMYPEMQGNSVLVVEPLNDIKERLYLPVNEDTYDYDLSNLYCYIDGEEIEYKRLSDVVTFDTNGMKLSDVTSAINAYSYVYELDDDSKFEQLVLYTKLYSWAPSYYDITIVNVDYADEDRSIISRIAYVDYSQITAKRRATNYGVKYLNFMNDTCLDGVILRYASEIVAENASENDVYINANRTYASDIKEYNGYVPKIYYVIDESTATAIGSENIEGSSDMNLEGADYFLKMSFDAQCDKLKYSASYGSNETELMETSVPSADYEIEDCDCLLYFEGDDPESVYASLYVKENIAEEDLNRIPYSFELYSLYSVYTDSDGKRKFDSLYNAIDFEYYNMTLAEILSVMNIPVALYRNDPYMEMFLDLLYSSPVTDDSDMTYAILRKTEILDRESDDYILPGYYYAYGDINDVAFKPGITYYSYDREWHDQETYIPVTTTYDEFYYDTDGQYKVNFGSGTFTNWNDAFESIKDNEHFTGTIYYIVKDGGLREIPYGVRLYLDYPSIYWKPDYVQVTDLIPGISSLDEVESDVYRWYPVKYERATEETPDPDKKYAYVKSYVPITEKMYENMEYGYKIIGEDVYKYLSKPEYNLYEGSISDLSDGNTYYAKIHSNINDISEYVDTVAVSTSDTTIKVVNEHCQYLYPVIRIRCDEDTDLSGTNSTLIISCRSKNKSIYNVSISLRAFGGQFSFKSGDYIEIDSREKTATYYSNGVGYNFLPYMSITAVNAYDNDIANNAIMRASRWPTIPYGTYYISYNIVSASDTNAIDKTSMVLTSKISYEGL